MSDYSVLDRPVGIASEDQRQPDVLIGKAQVDKLTVLVVEDNDADAYLIKRVLSQNPRVGDVVHARDGAEALDLLMNSSVRPDVAFVDLQMPKRDGFSLLLNIAAHKALSFPVVVLTSSKRGADGVRSRMRGATHFITKPNTTEKLAAALDPVIAGL